MPATKRWFSTGFMGGSSVASVDGEKHTLSQAVMIRPGEAMGHDLWIDTDFCKQVAEMANAQGDKGLKARFGHPNMCSEALGTFLGRWKNLSVDADGRVSGDLHLSSTAAESPKGDLRKYVEEMAAKEPEHFGASIVFTRNEEDENEFMQQNGAGTDRGFASPDPQNKRNLPHARCAQLHAADLVDDPAATDGMFSGIGGASLAAEMTEWLDLHPEVLKALNNDPGLVGIVERYADQLKPFIERYNANHKTVSAESVSVSTTVATPAEPDATLTAENASLKSLLDEARKEGERLAGEFSGNESALKAGLATAESNYASACKERDDALAKLAAIEKGAPPVSATPARKDGELTPWQKAQQSAPSRTRK